jgi:hypothetical protein
MGDMERLRRLADDDAAAWWALERERKRRGQGLRVVLSIGIVNGQSMRRYSENLPVVVGASPCGVWASVSMPVGPPTRLAVGDRPRPCGEDFIGRAMWARAMAELDGTRVEIMARADDGGAL